MFRQKKTTPYIFMLPWLIGFLILTLGAFLFTLYLAFTDYNILSAPEWVGLTNFKDILSDGLFIKSVSVTLLFVIVSVPLRLFFSLLIAMLLNQDIKGIGIYRTLFYLPSVIGTSVGVAIMWRSIFSSDGLVNSFLELFGISNAPSWVSNPDYAIYVIVLLSIWQFGAEMIIFLAGLKQVPQNLYDASLVDGASRFKAFIHVTLPMLTPLIFFNLVMSTLNAFMIFTQGYIITNGGPINSTLFYVIYLYQQGFEYFNMGYASALAIVFLFILAVIAGFLFLSSKYWVYYEGVE